MADAFKQKFNQEPRFLHKYIDFGLEDEEAFITAILDNNNHIPHWEFRSLFNADSRNLMDISSDAEASFGMMKWDLAQEA
jgi:hypothetical protein